MRVYRDASMIVFERPDLTEIVVSPETVYYENVGANDLVISHIRSSKLVPIVNIPEYNAADPYFSIADFAGTVQADALAAITYLNIISA